MLWALKCGSDWSPYVKDISVRFVTVQVSWYMFVLIILSNVLSHGIVYWHNRDISPAVKLPPKCPLRWLRSSMITWLDFSTIPQRYAKINLIKTAAASGTVLVCMDVSLQSAVLMYCTSMETVGSITTHHLLHSVEILVITLRFIWKVLKKCGH